MLTPIYTKGDKPVYGVVGVARASTWCVRKLYANPFRRTVDRIIVGCPTTPNPNAPSCPPSTSTRQIHIPDKLTISEFSDSVNKHLSSHPSAPARTYHTSCTSPPSRHNGHTAAPSPRNRSSSVPSRRT